MLRSLKATLDYGIQASDGLIGKVRDYLIEDDTWDIRYLVDDTGKWLPGRKVLIPTTVLQGPDWRNELFVVPRTKEEIEQGPHLDTQASVTRQMEAAMFEYHGWLPYWTPYGVATNLAPPMSVTESAPQTASLDTHPPVHFHRDADPRLQSFDDMLSFHLENNGDELGRVSDIIFDDSSWRATGIVFNTGGRLRSKKIQVDVDRVKGVLPDQGKITVEMTKDETEVCPSFNPTKLIQDQLQPEEDQRSLQPGSVAD